MSDTTARLALVGVSGTASAAITYLLTESISAAALAAVIAMLIAALTCGLAITWLDWMD
jgi:putative flippase GtrA